MNEHYRDLIEIGIGYMSAESYEQAKEKFLQAIEEDRDASEAYLHLGNAQMNLDEIEDGIDSFRKALVINEDGETLYSLACAYFLDDDYLNSIKYYNRAEKLGYKSVDMYEIMAEIFLKSNDFIQALRSIEKAISISPFRGELWSQKTLLQIQIGEIEGALETLDEYQSILPDAFDVYKLRIDTLVLLNEYEQALIVAKEAISRFPNDSLVNFIYLKALVDSDKYSEAKIQLKKMRDIGFDKGLEVDITMLEVEMYAAEENATKMIEVLNEALKIDENNESLLFMLLNTYIATGDNSNIKSVAVKMIDCCHSSLAVVTARFYYALACKRDGELERATALFSENAKLFRRMTVDDSSQHEVYMYRLLCEIELEHFKEALDLADYLENLYPEEVDGHAFRHLIYKKMGDDVNAQKELKFAREIKPEILEFRGE